MRRALYSGKIDRTKNKNGHYIYFVPGYNNGGYKGYKWVQKQTTPNIEVGQEYILKSGVIIKVLKVVGNEVTLHNGTDEYFYPLETLEDIIKEEQIKLIDREPELKETKMNNIKTVKLDEIKQNCINWVNDNLTMNSEMDGVFDVLEVIKNINTHLGNHPYDSLEWLFDNIVETETFATLLGMSLAESRDKNCVVIIQDNDGKNIFCRMGWELF